MNFSLKLTIVIFLQKNRSPTILSLRQGKLWAFLSRKFAVLIGIYFSIKVTDDKISFEFTKIKIRE